MLQKKWINSVDQYKTAFLASLMLIGAVAIYLWFVVPHRNYLKASQEYESTISTLSKKKQIIRNNLKVKKIELKELQEQFEDIQTKIFDTFQARDFFSNIEVVTKQADCKIILLEFSPYKAVNETSSNEPEKNNYVTTSTIQLSVIGGYGNITALMNKLQDNLKLIRISSIKINPDKQNPGYLKCDMTITIYVTNEKKDY